MEGKLSMLGRLACAGLLVPTTLVAQGTPCVSRRSGSVPAAYAATVAWERTLAHERALPGHRGLRGHGGVGARARVRAAREPHARRAGGRGGGRYTRLVGGVRPLG